MAEIRKIYPSPDELSVIKNNLQCTEFGCANVFTSESNLQMHLIKHHKRENLQKNEETIQYQCPETNCVYHGKKWFSKIKYLKQHYLKIHANKTFVCDKCLKGFSTLANKTKHGESCGISFDCYECGSKYTSYESLLVHCKRKKHKLLEKSIYTKKTSPTKPQTVSKNTLILPKIILQVSTGVTRENKEIQTDPWCETPKIKHKPIKRRSTQQTQTCVRKKVRKSAETQTTEPCIMKKTLQNVLNVPNVEYNYKKSSETQTKFTENLKSSETQTKCDNFDDKEISKLHSLSNNDLNLYNLNLFDDAAFNNCETQTDVIYQDTFLESNVFTSHIETQTYEMNDLDLYSNTHTQTCNDLFFPEFGFNDIQTQTTWPDYDMFVSTETQTYNTTNMIDLSLNGRGTSHMETQTETEFKQMLEEINA